MSSLFTALSPCPVTSTRIVSNLVSINDSEFVCATFKQTPQEDDDLGLYKYNTISNEWKLILKYPAEFESAGHRICYDAESNAIYMYGIKSQMININLTTMKINVYATDYDVGYYPTLLMLNSKCHIILGRKSIYHYKWNSNLNKMEEVFKFSQFENNEAQDTYYFSIQSSTPGLDAPGIIHIKSQNKLLLFGGWNPANPNQCSDEIFEYNINNKDVKWAKLDDVKLPLDMNDFTWVLSRNEEYLIIFGGEDIDGDRIENIFILDLSSMQFYSSRIKLTCQGRAHAVSMHNERYRLLISGFVRNISNEYDMNIPMDLVQLLGNYFATDTVYLLENGGKLNRIEMNDILNGKHSDLTLDFFPQDTP